MGRWGTLSNIQRGITSPNGTALLFAIYPAFTMNVNKQTTCPQLNAPALGQPVFLWAAAEHGKGRCLCTTAGPRGTHPCTPCTLHPCTGSSSTFPFSRRT